MRQSKWRRVLAAALSVLGLTVGLLTVTASPAAAILYYHNCAVLGTDSYGNQGVHCVNLYVDSDYVQASNEVLCQNAGTVVECAGIHENPGTCANFLTSCAYAGQGICGVRFGHSACGVRRVVTLAPALTEYCQYAYWAITANTSIVLPQSGTTVSGSLAGTHLSGGRC